jgi:hypothetical protein
MIEFLDDVTVDSEGGRSFPIGMSFHGKVRCGVGQLEEKRLIPPGLDKSNRFVGEFFG